MIKFTNDGNIVVFVAEDKKGKPVFVTSDESKIKSPYRVRYLENK